MTDEREGQSKHIEREFEIGKDEAWFANVKRTYDEFLEIAIAGARQNRLHFDKVIADAQQYDNMRQVMANTALQNAIETANMVGKQAVRHADLSIDRWWNVDEVSALTAKSGFQADVMAAVTAVLAARELAAK